ncbi:DUF4410 domain-containing protein [Bremerella sp. JC817]|uniref:DUF4410 domain-containing protein n=1 Tax=Bremerella sp. JC817 TaxID=3231756 RepID=UPI00345AB969
MDIDNPFKSPVDFGSSEPAVSGNTIQIRPFPIRMSRFHCSVLTPKEVSLMLHQELVNYCREQGLQVVEGPAARQIEAEIAEVEEGNQALRYLLPFLAGQAKVTVKGEIRQGKRPAQPFEISRNFHMGAFGGSSKTMIKQGLQRIAMQIGVHVGAETQPANSASSMFAKFYVPGVIVAALLLAIILATICYQTSLTWPERHDGMPKNERWIFWLMSSWMWYIACAAGGYAFAPQSVLTSRAFVKIREIVGVKSILAMRIVFGIFTVLPVVGIYFFAKLV